MMDKSHQNLVRLKNISYGTTIHEVKAKYECETGIAKEDCILKNWDGKMMEDGKTLRDYKVTMENDHNILYLETKSSWLLHFIHSTRLYPGLISLNMTEHLM